MVGRRQLFILGAPRSGTSLMQKILRDHKSFWSLPSESELVWHLYCHPKFKNWDSEAYGDEDVTPEAIRDIHQGLKKYSGPARLWRLVEKSDFIWSFKRSPRLRAVLGSIYHATYPRIGQWLNSGKNNIFLDKTASNSLRVGFVNEVFPQAKFIYITRNAYSNINSLINGWRNPTRFFTYTVPMKLEMPGYEFERWNFLLPPGWRDYVSRPLEQVCAFQWLACHEAIQAEIPKEKYKGRILQIKLEDLTADPQAVLRQITKFIGLPWDQYFKGLAENLPIVNSPDNNRDHEKWKTQNFELINNIKPVVAPMMKRLNYS